MSKITGKVNYKEVLKGDTGYTFEPHVTVDGILYWTNNGNFENPLPVNLHGKQGFVFIPHVDSEGNLSWTNTGELENPTTVNIKGDKGYFYTPHISQDGILTWSNNGDLENPQPFNISDLILNEVKESRVDTTGKTFTKLKERLDSDFKKLSESIKNNDTKDEVVQARTATTGENFMTLDDRIDHEVMRLREKIEVTMLEQEDKESHDISNTIEGMSSDMIIKGKTIKLDNEEIKSFGQEENKISILSSGLNMVNLSSWDVKEVVDGKQCYISHGYSSTTDDTGKPLILKLSKPIQQGENVTVISMNKATTYFNNFMLFNSQTKKTQSLGKNDQKNVWVNYKNTVPSNSYYDSIQIDTGDGNQKGFIETLFVGVGDNLNYQEYKEDKKDILLNKYNFESGLNGINNVCDEINSIKNIAIKRIGKREYQEGDLLLENVITDKINTYYVLEEPIETPLNENINLKTFNEKTYVSFENSINGTSSFKTPVNTNKLINDLKFEKEDLKEKFNNLTNEFENFKTYMIQTLPYKEV